MVKKLETLPNILKDFDKINYNKQIKIRYRKRPKSGYSLYLDIWNEGKHQYQFLKIYLTGKKEDSNLDKQKIKMASSVRDKKEFELMQQQSGFEFTEFKSKANFVDYFRELGKKRGHNNWSSCLNYMLKFSNSKLKFRQINRKFCEDFKEYLLDEVDSNTAQAYFAKFKASLNVAIKDGYIKTNPCSKVTIPSKDTQREFLSYEELQKLMVTPADDLEIKNAFIFSCLTGLRYSDVRALTFESLRDGYVYFRQQKTKGVERLKLHRNAVEIIDFQKKLREKSEKDQVFSLPLDSGTINKYIRIWMKDAGIKKHITFHCARHTAATLFLSFDVDIYTVSKILGHRDLKTTQIYAKLIDKKKDEAIDKIPGF